MLLRLFLLFTLIPVAELALLIRIGQWIGVGWTIALVLGTGLVGASAAKSQGTAVLLRIRESLEQGVLPGDDIANGFCILVGGILLVTPGLFTDLAGLFLLVPGGRDIAKRLFMAKIKEKLGQGHVNFRILS